MEHLNPSDTPSLPQQKDPVCGMEVNPSSAGFSIYHNTIVAYETGYTGGQHQDGVQTLGASYVKIYGNTIVGMSNSAIYLDGYGGERYPDFSQFKPRGHYTKTPALKNYFRCMM